MDQGSQTTEIDWDGVRKLVGPNRVDDAMWGLFQKVYGRMHSLDAARGALKELPNDFVAAVYLRFARTVIYIGMSKILATLDDSLERAGLIDPNREVN